MVALLEAEHDDVGVMAKEVLSLAWEHFWARDFWCCILIQPGVAVSAHGPYESEAALRRGVGKDVVAAGPDKGIGKVFRMSKGTYDGGVE